MGKEIVRLEVEEWEQSWYIPGSKWSIHRIAWSSYDVDLVAGWSRLEFIDAGKCFINRYCRLCLYRNKMPCKADLKANTLWRYPSFDIALVLRLQEASLGSCSRDFFFFMSKILLISELSTHIVVACESGIWSAVCRPEVSRSQFVTAQVLQTPDLYAERLNRNFQTAHTMTSDSYQELDCHTQTWSTSQSVCTPSSPSTPQRHRSVDTWSVYEVFPT